METRMIPENPERDMIVEDSLHTFPLAEAPAEFGRRVMGRVGAVPRGRQVWFGWTDVVLVAVFGLCAGAIYFGVQALPAFVTAPWRVQVWLLGRGLLQNSVWVLSAVGILAGLGSTGWAVTQYWSSRGLKSAS